MLDWDVTGTPLGEPPPEQPASATIDTPVIVRKSKETRIFQPFQRLQFSQGAAPDRASSPRPNSITLSLD
jgi:hypothetical protein